MYSFLQLSERVPNASLLPLFILLIARNAAYISILCFTTPKAVLKHPVLSGRDDT